MAVKLVLKSESRENTAVLNIYRMKMYGLLPTFSFDILENIPYNTFSIDLSYSYDEVIGSQITEYFRDSSNTRYRIIYTAVSKNNIHCVDRLISVLTTEGRYSDIARIPDQSNVPLYANSYYHVTLADPVEKRIMCIEHYNSIYSGYGLNIGEDKPRANNINATFLNTPAGSYSTKMDWIIGSQIINRAEDYVNVGVGANMKRMDFYYSQSSASYDAVFKNLSFPEYPNQNPDNDNDGSGQTPSDPPIPGDGDVTSDPIPDPPAKPIFDVTNTGFVVMYNPSVTEIRQLAYFMWSGDFTDLIKKMFASPFEAIISLKMLFCPITAGSAQTVWLGNVETDVTMAKITDQFTDVDLGTINVNEFFGSFADYAPFTKIQIYLPFIGFKDLNVDEVMNSQLHLRYRVDVYTGACIAYLTVTKTIKSTNLNSILYQFDGNCAMEIPFTSNDNSRYVAAIMNSVASSALSLANTSGFTTPVAGKGFNQKEVPSTFELGSLAPVANGMLDIMSAKPNVQRAGSLSGAVSAMAIKQPYIIIHRPIAQMPADYQKYLGIPLNLTRQLSNVKGYTVVSQVFMSSELATDREIAMITEALKNGVIL